MVIEDLDDWDDIDCGDDAADGPSWSAQVARGFVAGAQRQLSQATALLWLSMAQALDAAREAPSDWVPMHPDRDPGSRERDLAVRACAADLGMRLGMPAPTVRRLADRADRGRRRLPGVWEVFYRGGTSPQHLEAALEASNGLDEESVVEFDEAATRMVSTGITAVRLRARLRTLAARIDRRVLRERRAEAFRKRGVWVEHTADGMAWLSAYLPSESAAAALAHLTASAAALRRSESETRTQDQLRADVAADLLTARGTPWQVRTVVGVTVPVMSLLGASDQPASLDGVVPIDAETARRLCGEATSMFRILTDPIRSTVLDLDDRVYRPPAGLQRFVRLRDQTCTNPICSRSAARTDLDHVVPWAAGGSTSADNLAALCSSCHHLKHDTLWSVAGTDGRMTWSSPAGDSWETPEPVPIPHAVPDDRPPPRAAASDPPRPSHLERVSVGVRGDEDPPPF